MVAIVLVGVWYVNKKRVVVKGSFACGPRELRNPMTCPFNEWIHNWNPVV